MSGFRTIKEVIDAELNGNVRVYNYVKNPTVSNATRFWADLSMSPGNPPPKYWFDASPLTAKAIYQSTDGGFFHGTNVSPNEKYARIITVQSTSTTASNAAPMTLLLCDYLLYYPTVDDGTTDEQLMNNSITLPRYTDGKGVQMIAVTTGARTGGQTFTIKYTNQDGVTGRVTPTLTQNNSSSIGTLTHVDNNTINGAGPFIPLQDGDSGVRAVESVTMDGVDTGLFSVILVKPLLYTMIAEGMNTSAQGFAYEKDLLMYDNNLPKIYDDAFLNFLVLPSTNLSTTQLRADLKVIFTQ